MIKYFYKTIIVVKETGGNQKKCGQRTIVFTAF